MPLPTSAGPAETNASFGTATPPPAATEPSPAEAAALREGARFPWETPAEPSPPPAPRADGGTDLWMDDTFLRSLPPFQRREVEQFTESLPRYLVDPAEDGFAYRAGHVLFPEPVDFEIGGMRVGGGLVTAIERGNPFALLNFLDLFHVTW